MNFDGKTVSVVYEISGKISEEYPVEVLGNVLTFTMPGISSASAGSGKLQLRIYGEKSLLHSAIIPYTVKASLDPGPAEEDQVPMLVLLVQQAQEAIDSANAASKRANDVANDVQEKLDSGAFVGPQGKQGPQGVLGADGKDAVVDATLTQSGQAADAKVTGDAIGQLKGDLDSKIQFGDPYDGVDLTVKHSSEITDYASPWAWIKARIAAGNFSQLHVGDYIPFTTTNGRTFQAQIAGINTYKGYGDSEVGNHIDFITRELWPDTFQMNPVNFNNGTSRDKQVPWLASNGYLFVNSLAGQVPNSTTKPLEMTDVDYTSGGIYFYLPDDLKAVIIEKRIYAQTRFSDSGVLTNDNGAAWVNMGKLWLPDEYEVMGARLMTSTGWFCGGYVHYPIFAHSMNRVKRVNGKRLLWWLSSASGGSATYYVYATSGGNVHVTNTTFAARAPLCFRVS